MEYNLSKGIFSSSRETESSQPNRERPQERAERRSRVTFQGIPKWRKDHNEISDTESVKSDIGSKRPVNVFHNKRLNVRHPRAENFKNLNVSSENFTEHKPSFKEQCVSHTFPHNGLILPERSYSTEDLRSSSAHKTYNFPNTSLAAKNTYRNSNLPELLPDISNVTNATSTTTLDSVISYLTDLRKKEPRYIVFEILKDRSFFGKIIRRKIDRDSLFLLMQIIGKLCQSEFSQDESLMKELCLSKLPRAISHYFEHTFTRDRGPIYEAWKLFENVTAFYSCVVDIASYIDFVETLEDLLKLTKNSIHNLNGRYDYDTESALADELKALMMTARAQVKEIKRSPNRENNRSSFFANSVSPPLPTNFRELNSFLTPADLKHRGLDPYIQRNSIKGINNDVQRYLQLRFRILREDFVEPVRQGVQQYLRAKHQSRRPGKLKLKFGSIKFYENVRFEELEFGANGNVGVVLNFDTNEKMKLFKWEASKRLTYGSLLLFSRDDFETLFCATVLERNIEKLKTGRLLVQLTCTTPMNYFLLNGSYLMAESEAFYELYHESMEAFKNLKENSFPMKEYVIGVKKKPDIPAYTQNSTIWDIFGFDSELPGIENWPIASEIGLDQYQYEALKHCLMKKLCLILGAPGTGKTFLALKIIQILLKNAELNPFVVEMPILVVAPTNYCLDRFLEGMLQFPQVPEMVRIAGPSHNEVLKQFDLRGELKLSTVRKNAKELFPGILTAIENVNDCRRKLEELNNRKKAFQHPCGIIKLSILSNVIRFRRETNITKHNDLIEWLTTGENFPKDEDTRSRISLENRRAVNQESESDLLETDCCSAPMERSIVNEDTISAKEEINLESIYCCTIKDLEELYSQKEKEYRNIKKLSRSRTVVHQKNMLEEELKSMMQKLRVIKSNLQTPMNDVIKVDLHVRDDFRQLPLETRWLLYWKWIDLLRNDTDREIAKLEAEYHSKMEHYEAEKRKEDLYVLQNVSVIGTTLIGAVKFQKLFKKLQPAIVVVDEASQIFESHLLAFLPEECQHLILLGDNKQLKQRSAVYELSKNYSANESLFERMIENGVDFSELKLQYRMRTEFSNLLSSQFYRGLENHHSIYEHEPIKGVEKSLFFFEHEILEEKDDTNSKKNIFEAEFAVELARYLVLQGYNPKDITLLTTYEGQVYVLREIKQKHKNMLKEISCFFLDEYLGHVNDIVILSLVRSNEKGKIGYLDEENRVCSALSRATKGLYMIGNVDTLTKKSKVWCNVKENLEKQRAIGKEMRLFCEIHQRYTSVSNAEDFNRVRDGGCWERCGVLMSCGHTCDSLCHTLDREHKYKKCIKPCERMCARELHSCDLYCYQECVKCFVPIKKTPPCGHVSVIPCFTDESKYECPVEVDDISPLCQHNVRRKCQEKPEDVDCMMQCEDRLDCGHACTETCHKKTDPDHLNFKCQKDCEKSCPNGHKCEKRCFEDCGKCSVSFRHTLDCGHEVEDLCSTDVSDSPCYQHCLKICPDCNLRCAKSCNESCAPCSRLVERTVAECGHIIVIKCGEGTPTRKRCIEKCDLIAPCGHKCRLMCKDKCESTSCTELVRAEQHMYVSCGHKFVSAPCNKTKFVTRRLRLLRPHGARKLVYIFNADDYLKFCDAPCNKILACGDVCSGTCWECMQGRRHVICQQPCKKTLICGHTCKSSCEEVCPPCTENCGYRCKHSKCPKQCGAPCVPCLENCDWRCKHSACTRKCGSLCDREPCYEPCDVVLKCGHPCISFCGEPCPKLCRICDEEVTEILFGFEDEPDARFVLLEDCGHVIESRALDKHLVTSPQGGEIIMKVCPLCKSPIMKTLRYMNHVKRTYEHIINVKKIIYGHPDLILKNRNELHAKLRNFLHESHDVLHEVGMVEISSIIEEYLNIVATTNKCSTLHLQQITAINSYYEVFVNLTSRMRELIEPCEFVHGIVQWIKLLIVRSVDTSGFATMKINRQQMDDLSDELRRYHKMVDFGSVLGNPVYKRSLSLTHQGRYVDEYLLQEFNDIYKLLFGYTRFTEQDENKVNELMKPFQKRLSSNKPLTAEEKRMINLAMSVNFSGGRNRTGHWFTCSKGHYYCITECGGPTQLGKCPECGELIGGTDHTYLPTARLASDMDGATHPAWHTDNDMRNFEIDDDEE